MSKSKTSASAWHALNVESDHEADDDVDDTQEIQIEEALKLYQTALKLHSEGPASATLAAVAYRALFDSDIFKYTESLSEYQRHELFGDTLVFDSILEDDFEAGPAQSTGAADSAPNTLPQILHLSYKNHGQFLLESMQHASRPATNAQTNTLNALNDFAQALDKEDTDLDLWLRAASVAAMLGSKRLTRFCLEATLDGNDELWESLLRLPGIEEGFAGQQLRELVGKLEDNVSLMQAPLSSMKPKKLSATLKKRLNPYPFAPLPADVVYTETPCLDNSTPQPIALTPNKWDWSGVGDAILQQFMAEQIGTSGNTAPGSRINITVPSDYQTSEPSASDTPSPSEQIANEQSTLPQTLEPAHAADSAETSAQGAIEDTVMADQDSAVDAKTEDVDSAATQGSAPPPSRKRSTDSAGLPETAEGIRSQSKRIRTRHSLTNPAGGADSVVQDANKQLEDQLEPFLHADQCLYEIVKDIYSRLGVSGLGQPKDLRDQIMSLPTPSATEANDKAACDLFLALQNGSAKTAQVLLSSESFDLVGVTREAGLNAFLGYAKSGTGPACVKPVLEAQRLGAFVRSINSDWLSTKEVAFAWVEKLLSRGSFHEQQDDTLATSSSYMQFRWAEDLKRNLVQIIVHVDEYIYERLRERLDELNARMLNARLVSQTYELTDFDSSQIEIVETLFELHLDIYSLIKHPHSEVDASTQILQSDRLERWATLAREVIQLRSDCDPDAGFDDLALRHIWATVFQLSVKDEVPPEHVLSAIAELKTILDVQDDRLIHVQNNAVMPEISVAALDRELVRISMKDFFLKVFDHDEKDPVTVIESLEPILEQDGTAQPLLEPQVTASEERVQADSPGTDVITSQEGEEQEEGEGEGMTSQPSPVIEMRKFLDSANVNVRLSLWQRLREAYEGIEYPPKVLSCYLRSIETFVDDFKSTIFQEMSLSERQVKLLIRFRVIDEMIVKVLQIMRGEPTAFDCLSYEHVQSSMSAVAGLLHIMSSANMFRDLIRVGHVTVPRIETLPSQTFTNMSTRLDDIQMRLWSVQYYLLREGISQNPEEFPAPSEDLFEFLRHVHHATGVRGFCHQSSRQFLRLAKDEVLRLKDVHRLKDDPEHAVRDTEFCQILHDLYGLKPFIGSQECQDFASSPDSIDKKTAFSLLPFVMSQVSKVDLKDLPKTELKAAVEKVHAALGRPKQHDDITFNRKMISAYLKSPITPVSLFNCLKGVGLLPTKHIPAEEAVAASKGWYYLMGNIALSRFRSQKRMTQGPTEDLNYAQAFFVQDLEYSVERWETWYRLAQINDAQLEEAVSWNADKMNSNSVELINYQRAAINCYIMAVACAVRDSNIDGQTIKTEVAQMYLEFGTRIYASSREPFGMDAFQTRDNERRFVNLPGLSGAQRDIPFVPLQLYTAWKFAGALFKRAIKCGSKKWWNHYMLGKCFWKMWAAQADTVAQAYASGGPTPVQRGPSWEEVINAIATAIETLPDKKGRSGEPILEPHYKLVSIVHKMFQRRAVDYQKGSEAMAHTSYAKNISAPENAEDWERYIIAILKALRSADKSSWHHRIIARSAHIIYDEGKDPMLAHGAKNELMQQIFTKTMAVQVWKPENERPGRHFVYTTRYTKFFVDLLLMTGDKANFEALAKRVRRKQTDFFEHTKLWQELCLRYLKMLRQNGNIQDGQEDSAFKSVNQDDFIALARRLEAWCQNSTVQHPVLDVLRDAFELKRLNNGLMKSSTIDDLIGDSYATLYVTIGPTLPPLPSEQPAQPAPTSGGQASTGTVSIASLMHMQVDGPTDPNASPAFSMYHANQHPAPAPVQPEAVPKPRAKAVGKREIQRRAEACTQKPVSTATSSTTAMPIRSPLIGNTGLPTRISSPEKSLQTSGTTGPSGAALHGSFDQSGTATAASVSADGDNDVDNDNDNDNDNEGDVEGDGEGDGDGDGEGEGDNDHDMDNEGDGDNEAQDDADDESELSELDDMEVHEMSQEAERRAGSITAVRPLFPNLMAGRTSADAEANGRVQGGEDDEADEGTA
jgi:hypothetical protein